MSFRNKDQWLSPVRLLLLLAPLSLGACGRDKEPTPAPEPSPDLGQTPNPGAVPPTANDQMGSGSPSASASDTTTTGDMAAAEGSKRTPGQVLDDGAITAKVKSKLLADDQVKGLKIDVDTRQGEVTLSGTVENQTQADRAISLARETEGVSTVQSQLTVRPKA